jgi:hypothetical protein
LKGCSLPSNSGTEALETGEWIKAQLDTALIGTVFQTQTIDIKAYAEVIPEDVDLPAIRFHVQFPKDVMVIAGVRVMTQIDWLVALVHEGLILSPLIPIVAKIDQALHLQKGSTAGVSVFECTRLGPFTQVSTEPTGTQYRHLGGTYRTLSQAI